MMVTTHRVQQDRQVPRSHCPVVLGTAAMYWDWHCGRPLAIRLGPGRDESHDQAPRGALVAVDTKADPVAPVKRRPLAFELSIANRFVRPMVNRIYIDRIGVDLPSRRLGGFTVQERHRNLDAARSCQGLHNLELRPGDDLRAEDDSDSIESGPNSVKLQLLTGLDGPREQSQTAVFNEIDAKQDETLPASADAKSCESMNAPRRCRPQVIHSQRAEIEGIRHETKLQIILGKDIRC